MSIRKLAKALAKPVKSRSLKPVERDYLGPIVLSPDVFSGKTELSEASVHPLELSAMTEELPRLTAAADQFFKAVNAGVSVTATSELPAVSASQQPAKPAIKHTPTEAEI